MKCTKCKGMGKFFPPEGTTKSDMKHCNICDGTGERPFWYEPKKQKKGKPKEYMNRKMGLDELEFVKEV